MKFLILIFSILIINNINAQNADAATIRRGNEMYARKSYDSAVNTYSNIENKKNKYISDFNSGNALNKQEKYADAVKKYDEAKSNATDKTIQAQALYNKGVSQLKQKDTKGAIQSFKQSLKLNSYDEQCRENLQKAIKEDKQQEQQKQEQKPKPEPKDNKDKNKQNKPNNPKQQRQKQKIDDLLDNLAKEEKKLQEKLMQKSTVQGTEKDW